MAEKQEQMPGSEKEELMKEKYAELRMAAAEIKQLQQQLEAVEEKKQELEAASASLGELKKTKEKTRMLAPITEGIFIKASVESSNELLVNVGSNICVKKTIDETRQMLEAKAREISSYQESLLDELTKVTEQADSLEAELGKMLQEE